MPRVRTPSEAAAGKLILAIQREWGLELGHSTADISEHVMGLAHDLLQASKKGELEEELGARTVTDFLGTTWVKRHPSVVPAIEALEATRAGGAHA